MSLKKLLPALILVCLAGGFLPPAFASTTLFEKPAPAEETEREVILLTHSSDGDSYTNQVAGLFKKYLEEASDEHFQVDIYPNDTLGGLGEAAYSLRAGTTQMRFGPGPAQLPMLLCYRSLTGMTLEELQEALRGEALRALIDQEAARYGVRILGFLPASYRLLSSNKKIQRTEDLKDLKIRIFNNVTSDTFWTSLGADPSVYSYSEVYSAMQSGLIEANPEATLQDIISMGFYEQQKYVVNIRQQVYLEPVYVSQKYFDSLDEEEQGQLLEAVERALEEAEPLLEGIHARARVTLSQAGVEWVEFPEAEQEKVLEAVREPMEKQLRIIAGDTLVSSLLEVLDKP